MPVTPCQPYPALFTAPEGERTDGPAYRSRIHQAKLLCSWCPIKTACRDEAREKAFDGVWGGEDDLERASTRRPPAIGGGRRRADCGTEAGAQRHRRNSEPPCGRCRVASADAGRERKQAKAAEARTKIPGRAAQLLGLMDAGLTATEIAEELGLDRKSIYSLQGRLRYILGADNAHLVEAGRAAGILTDTAEQVAA